MNCHWLVLFWQTPRFVKACNPLGYHIFQSLVQLFVSGSEPGVQCCINSRVPIVSRVNGHAVNVDHGSAVSDGT